MTGSVTGRGWFRRVVQSTRQGLVPGLPLLLALSSVQAAELRSFSPEGEAGGVTEVRAQFSAPMVAVGDRKAAPPFQVDCAAPAQGFWADQSTWVLAFEKSLPAGLTCRFTTRPRLASLAGEAVRSKPLYVFNTGGPRVLNTHPWVGATVEEHNAFLLTLSAPVDVASVKSGAWCALEGVAERVPLKLIEGKEREQLIQTVLGMRPRGGAALARYEDSERAMLAVQCAQAATPKTKMAIVWGAGIQSVNGIRQSTTRRLEYAVRDVFTATMSCERENAQAPCTPIRPITLSFSSPVPLKQAEQIRLKTPDGVRQPQIGSEERKQAVVGDIRFMPPFAEKAELSLELPGTLTDDAGRTLSNARLFPLALRTAGAPPLAKFASAEFGLIERKADPVVPITLRRIELPAQAAGAQLRRLAVDDDVEILNWFGRLREAAGRERGSDDPKVKDSRAQSLLTGTRAETLALPRPGGEPKEGEYPFEVVGLPMPKPGFFVLELESARLGESLLARGPKGPMPMFVKTMALVTNLSVHLRQGEENSLVWVTTLDKAAPVRDAALRLTDCFGKTVWEGSTDAQGRALIGMRLNDMARGSGDCKDGNLPRYMLTARAKGADGVTDLGLVLSEWNRGIETWRFNLPYADTSNGGQRHQAVLDRSLLRAGETLSFKLFSRLESSRGLTLMPSTQLPKALEAVHLGSGDRFAVPMDWRDNRFAKGQWAIPRQARLGVYELRLKPAGRQGRPGLGNAGNDASQDDDSSPQVVASFRVSEFKLPTMTGRVQLKADATKVAPERLPLALQLDYLSSGPAAHHAMTVSALMSPAAIAFDGFDGFSFRPPPVEATAARGGVDAEGEEGASQRRVVASNLPVKLDAKGSGAVVIEKMPALREPADVQFEATYADANGEIQTLSSKARLWPAALVVGLKTESWVSVEKALNTQVVVLDHAGKPISGQQVEIRARLRETLSTRKRLVGGFYAFDNSVNYRDLGRLCSATTNSAGLATCKLDIKTAGNIELTAQAKDREGHLSQAFSDLWVTDRGELWFEGEDHDRIDLLPEKRRYQPGETARFQVRMPFRHATALVAVEREGVIDSFTVSLHGKDPTLEVPIKADYGPNVYISALVVRERLREVPWYSFFQWGWRAPVDWWKAFRENLSPTATVDLAKPAHKLGIAEVQVGLGGQALKVQVKADQSAYQVRSRAKVRVSVSDAQGKPLPAGTSVAFAAVDQALLELAANDSWNLLERMWMRRGYGMETYTAQMHVVGKRHYGRKAAPPGGGGGMGPTRELFDTLLLWNPEVVLNDKGEADIEVPLNDSLSRFRLVAVADHGSGQFGTGSTTIESRQDLQLIPGLPQLARSDDQYSASVTLRNTTARAMKVEVSAALEGQTLKLPPQTVEVPAQGAQELAWTVGNGEILRQQAGTERAVLTSTANFSWLFTAREVGGSGSDRVRIQQSVLPAIKPAVQQASLLQLGAESSALPLGLPPQTLPGSGSAQVSLSRSLLGSQTGLREFFRNYPFACLEQRTSKAIGLRDANLWRVIVSQLPLYLDGDGLAMYFPDNAGQAKGYDILTAYLLAVSHEAGWEIPDGELQRMHKGLTAFVEGRLTREFWSPQKDLAVRKLAAIEALSRRGVARPEMLEALTEDLVAWPTQALVDYRQILKRLPQVKDRDNRLRNTDNALRARLALSGTRMGFVNEQGDYWWWLMGSADLNANRLILAMMGEPAWSADIGRLVTGSLARQERGLWMTTTANVWGSLMLERFASEYERVPVSGQTRAAIAGGKTSTFNWPRDTDPAPATLPFQVAAGASTSLSLQHAGEGRPWAQVQVLAAVPRNEPVAAGYRINKTMTLVEGGKSAGFKRGDLVRVRVTVTAATPMTWVVIDDPIPAGAVVQGRGLGRDSAMAASGQQGGGSAWPVFQEIGYAGVKSYFDYVPKGEFSIEYTMRLNTRGEFALPATRAEAMYAPEVFGEFPNPKMAVQ